MYADATTSSSTACKKHYLDILVEVTYQRHEKWLNGQASWESDQRLCQGDTCINVMVIHVERKTVSDPETGEHGNDTMRA